MSVTQDGLVTTFTYDADGRRVKKVTPWGTTYYIGEHPGLPRAGYEKYVPSPGLSVLPGDVDLDCQVSVADIQTIAGRWGEAWSLPYDVDQDGSEVDAGDIQTAAANWPAGVPNPCNQATTKYYRLGGRLIALRQNGQLRYVHTDHLGSLSLLTDEGAHAVPGSLQRFYPFGTTRAGQPVILPLEDNFTGQRLDVNTGLLYYSDGRSYGRYYDPLLGRFIQPDIIVPNPGNPQALNRYAYVYNNPLKYTDPTGHCPLCVAVGILVLRGIDYGWTAYDAWQATRMLRNPGASTEDRLVAGLTIALAGLEVIEPDELLPISLPLDDVARRGITAGFREALQQGGLKAGVRYLRGALGEQAPRAIRHLYEQGAFREIRSAGEWADILGGVRKEAGLEVHHLIEKRFAERLEINAADIPSIVLTKEEHQMFTNMWRAEIGYVTDDKFVTTANATRKEIWAAAQKIYAQYPELLEAVRKTLFGQ